jgi:GMP synthase-like glutamine amidotransferase
MRPAPNLDRAAEESPPVSRATENEREGGKMKIHYLQHVPFEAPGMIAEWAGKKGHAVEGTRLFDGQTPPAVGVYDWLVVMGGPMSIYDHQSHSWLEQEKRAIERAIERGKVVVGVCLGAQLVADALGAKVNPNASKEIGWFPVTLTAEAKDQALTNAIPHRFTAFHWHGDTFDLPDRAVHLATSEACANQMFVYDNRVLGLQFHLEMTERGISDLIENCRNEIAADRYIQSADAMLEGKSHLQGGYAVLDCLLDRLETITQSQSR